MDMSSHFVLMILLSKCIAVRIKELNVPPLVQVGEESITLDCDYTVEPNSKSGLVVKWFFNERNLVYQWIPPMRPQVIGILKDKIVKDYRVSEDPLEVYRAIRILRPTTDLSGNYTCAVSTFMEEDRRSRHMLVYRRLPSDPPTQQGEPQWDGVIIQSDEIPIPQEIGTGKNFHFVQEKKYVFLVTLLCVAEDLYPKPEMFILSQGRPIKQALTEVNMNSWGLYTVKTKAVIHDDDVTGPFEKFVCELRLPPANYSVSASTIYYPGLMPTIQIAAVEVAEKSQDRKTNGTQNTIGSILVTFSCIILMKIIYGPF